LGVNKLGKELREGEVIWHEQKCYELLAFFSSETPFAREADGQGVGRTPEIRLTIYDERLYVVANG